MSTIASNLYFLSGEDYISCHPSKNQIAGSPVDNGQPVFETPLPTEKDLLRHLNSIKDLRIPFLDIYWFLQPRRTLDGANELHYSSTEIIIWMGSLYYEVFYGEKNDDSGFYIIKSLSDPLFSLCSFKTKTCPQIPIHKNDQIVVITFSDGKSIKMSLDT